MATSCRLAPQTPPVAGDATSIGAAQLASQLMPRVAALQQLLAFGATLDGASGSRLADLRDAVAQLAMTLQHARADGAGSSAAIVHAATAVTVSAQQAGVPDCGMLGA